MEIEKLLRKNIRAFKPYSSARDEYTEKHGIFLDANENSLGSVSSLPANRYPDPYQHKLKGKLAKIKDVLPENIFLGNGSDEAIDLLIRAFCEPRQDAILTMPPTYGMYKVCADLNDVATIEIPLNENFEIDVSQTIEIISDKIKLIFICSPNNPSGNLVSKQAIETLAGAFSGLIIIDEAYLDYAQTESWIENLTDYQNIVVLQTFSKAWGMAGLRLGMAFAQKQIIQILNNIKYPYNINFYTQTIVEEALSNIAAKDQMVTQILKQRNFLEKSLAEIKNVETIFPSNANFILVRFSNAQKVYNKLIYNQIIVRDRSSLPGCNNCLRITVGTEKENHKLINVLKEIEKEI